MITFSCRICEYSCVVWRRNGLIVPPSSRLKQVTTHDVTILPRLCRKPEIIPFRSDRNLRAKRKKTSRVLALINSCVLTAAAAYGSPLENLKLNNDSDVFFETRS